MLGKEPVQAREFGDDILLRAPVEAVGLVDADFFVREPLDAVGESEPATHAGERAEAVAQERPRATIGFAGGEARVVVGLTVMDQYADARALLVGVVEVALHLRAAELLEEFAEIG